MIERSYRVANIWLEAGVFDLNSALNKSAALWERVLAKGVFDFHTAASSL